MEPFAVLSSWAAGVAAGTALVARWGIVGLGFARLGGGVVLVLGVPAALSGGNLPATAGCILTGLVVLTAGRRPLDAALGASAALAFVGAAVGAGYPMLAITGALALGGVTTQMLLGHWYLVDPRLPRRALLNLGALGVGGTIIDPAAALIYGALPSSGLLPIGWVVLVITSVVLMFGVRAALKERGYPAVMAATGLAYLAVLTTIGVVLAGRVLVSGESLG